MLKGFKVGLNLGIMAFIAIILITASYIIVSKLCPRDAENLFCNMFGVAMYAFIGIFGISGFMGKAIQIIKT